MNGWPLLLIHPWHRWANDPCFPSLFTWFFIGRRASWCVYFQSINKTVRGKKGESWGFELSPLCCSLCLFKSLFQGLPSASGFPLILFLAQVHSMAKARYQSLVDKGKVCFFANFLAKPLVKTMIITIKQHPVYPVFLPFSIWIFQGSAWISSAYLLFLV